MRQYRKKTMTVIDNYRALTAKYTGTIGNKQLYRPIRVEGRSDSTMEAIVQGDY